MTKRTVGEIERDKRAQKNELDLHIEPKFWDGKSWRYPYKEETMAIDSDKSNNDYDSSKDGADETTITDSDGITWHDVG